MVSNTVIEYVMGELSNASRKYIVKLKLTVTEKMVNERPAPVARTVARHELTPMSGIVIEDDNYTLRYDFDGQQQQHSVRTQGGTLLAA